MDKTKDIQYFLNAEKEFCKEHPDYGTLYFDEKYGMGKVGDNDQASFLIHRPFEENFSRHFKLIGNEDKYGLTDAERILLNMYYAQHSAKFRDDYYHSEIPEVVKQMFMGINNVVAKAPQNHDKILYRFCQSEDPKNMKVGETISFPYNLTCTNYDWKQAKFKNVYVITPLQDGNTKAHNLYDIYEHGQEKQIDFLRGTSFKVTKIEKTKGTPYKKFYLSEV
ncbi:hypothetical protein KSW79_06130 [Prevotella copri]|uniref:hypothetical protein n=2 Tax=Segatella TaxID=2974251 RepID=UPI001C38CDCF|nr:hypothetical protein [Segatella copri]MBV3413977.1 hypothetical protein [Segatella copri]